MMSQPILELDNSLIDGLRGVRNSRLCDATLDQAAHIFGREELMLTVAAAFASMSRKLRDDAIIDIDKHDLGPAQPLGKVTSTVLVTCHRQPRVPKGS
jgi:hypothetical protein